MPGQAITRGVPDTGTPFAFRLLLLFVAVHLTVPALSAPCPAERVDERVRVSYVYDGDTVKLTDGRRLRFIGINTPELDSDRDGTAAIAARARQALQDMLDRNDRVLLLQTGREQRDHFGRQLAHAFLQDGDNVAARLLQQGLATTVVVPPNTWGMDCYRRQENTARSERSGLWALPVYQSLDSNALPSATRGYRIVYGPVTAVDDNGGTLRLRVGERLDVYIRRRDRINFPAGFTDRLAGRTIEVRGWIRPAGTTLRMNAAHPAAITLFSDRKTDE